MDKQALLTMLKSNLEKVSSVNDDYLSQLIDVSILEIEREGVVLAYDEESGYSIDDGNLIVMYAAYLYRRRVPGTEGYQTAALNPQGMPYMLRLALNNRLMYQATEVAT